MRASRLQSSGRSRVGRKAIAIKALRVMSIGSLREPERKARRVPVFPRKRPEEQGRFPHDALRRRHQ